jgi:beta-N-acetylhexosaminidase/D-alanyl-D-alanine dipeptidase
MHIAKMQAAAKEADLVDMSEFAPSIALDIRYATPNNFTKQQVYNAPRCLLRREVAKRVQEVQAALAQQGKGLKLFDCYRPPAAQQKFWDLVPDERYVSNPAKGSRHTKGTAVDLTIVDAQGNEVEMPLAFDDFTERAHREGNGASETAQANMKLLESLMVKQGFEPLPTEWWHFDLQGWRGYSDINIDL